MAHEEEEGIWSIVLVVNSVLWSAASLYFVFSVGASILLWNAKLWIIGFIVAGIFTFSEVVIGILSE